MKYKILTILLLLNSSILFAQSSLTVYKNFGYIQEDRHLQLSTGTNLYQIKDIAQNIETGSIVIEF